MASGARARGWGDPDSPGYRQKHIVRITAGGRDLWVRREVAHLFKGFIDEIVARGYRIDLGGVDDWGFANRDIRGRPGVKSNHSWGLAVDLNARTNPMGPKLITDMPAWVVDVAEKWGLLWGGAYRTRPDAMHFEFVGRPGDVARYPLQLEEDLTVMDPATQAYLDQKFAAIDGRLDVLEDSTAVLRGAIKGKNTSGGKSALWVKLEQGFAAVVDAVKADKG